MEDIIICQHFFFLNRSLTTYIFSSNQVVCIFVLSNANYLLILNLFFFFTVEKNAIYINKDWFIDIEMRMCICHSGINGIVVVGAGVGSQAGEVQWGWRVDRITQRGVGRLDSEVPQHDGVSLDAVALLVVIGSVQELPGEVGPLSAHSLSVQTADLHQLVLQGQHPARVGTLRTAAFLHVTNCWELKWLKCINSTIWKDYV